MRLFLGEVAYVLTKFVYKAWGWMEESGKSEKGRLA